MLIYLFQLSLQVIRCVVHIRYRPTIYRLMIGSFLSGVGFVNPDSCFSEE